MTKKKQGYNTEFKVEVVKKVTTDSKDNKCVYQDVLNQHFDSRQPNKSWGSDMTYI